MSDQHVVRYDRSDGETIIIGPFYSFEEADSWLDRRIQRHLIMLRELNPDRDYEEVDGAILSTPKGCKEEDKDKVGDFHCEYAVHGFAEPTEDD